MFMRIFLINNVDIDVIIYYNKNKNEKGRDKNE